MFRLFKIAEKHLPTVHRYADDTQLYLSFCPDSSMAQDCAVLASEAVISEVWSLLISLKLKFNGIKTEFIVIGTRQQISTVDIASLKIGSADITPISSVRNLGAWFDDRMAMNVHVGMVCKKAFRGLYNIRKIRKFLSFESTRHLSMLLSRAILIIVTLYCMVFPSIIVVAFREF